MSAATVLPGRAVLLIDDEAAMIHVIRRMLEMGGYAVTAANSAAEGLRLLGPRTWDVVITDRIMPEMDGEEMAAQIRERAPQMPILMITGFPESVVHPDRFAGVIRKPFASRELLSEIARTLAKSA